jgi:hypothetical protein
MRQIFEDQTGTKFERILSICVISAVAVQVQLPGSIRSVKMKPKPILFILLALVILIALVYLGIANDIGGLRHILTPIPGKVTVSTNPIAPAASLAPTSTTPPASTATPSLMPTITNTPASILVPTETPTKAISLLSLTDVPTMPSLPFLPSLPAIPTLPQIPGLP